MNKAVPTTAVATADATSLHSNTLAGSLPHLRQRSGVDWAPSALNLPLISSYHHGSAQLGPARRDIGA